MQVFMEPNSPKWRHIPYDNTAAAQYVDLKRDPSAVSDLPEVADCPELEKFLSSVNGEQSQFRTLACKHWCKPITSIDQSSTAFEFASTIEIALEVLWLTADFTNYQQVVWRFSQYIKHLGIPNEVIARFQLQHVIFDEHQFGGWCLVAWVYGIGETQNEARERWAQGLDVLAKYLDVESQTLPRGLVDGRKTIS